jgi:hypothetical protein
VKRLGTVRGCRGEVAGGTGVKAAVVGVWICSVGLVTGSDKSFPHNCSILNLPLGWTEVYKNVRPDQRYKQQGPGHTGKRILSILRGKRDLSTRKRDLSIRHTGKRDLSMLALLRYAQVSR